MVVRTYFESGPIGRASFQTEAQLDIKNHERLELRSQGHSVLQLHFLWFFEQITWL